MNWNLIHKYLSVQCTDKEKEKVEQWLQEDADHQAFLDSIQQIWEVEPKKEGRIDVMAAWDEFQKKRMTSPKVDHVKNFTRVERKNYRSIASTKWYQRKSFYAAAAVILLLATVLFVANNQQGTPPEEITYQEVITAKGEKTSVRLSDGTHVMLNAASSMKIPSNYGDKTRTLYLEGEAFFEVEHNEARPFRVYSGEYYTEDLGTKFNIRAFPADTTLEVVVAEGEVEMGKTSQTNKDSVHLRQNERAVGSQTAGIYKQKVNDLSSYIGWTQGKLIFNDTPLGQVVKQLERWYDVQCDVQNKTLLNKRLTAVFKNEPLSNVLQLISKSMNIETKIENRTVIIKAD